MTEMEEYDMQIMIASGPEALSRAVLGFAFAVSAVAAGARVLVILTLEGTAWLTEDYALAQEQVNGFDSIESYLTVLKEAGAAVRLCSACVTGACAMTAANHEFLEDRPYVGLTEAAIRVAQKRVQTVVF